MQKHDTRRGSDTFFNSLLAPFRSLSKDSTTDHLARSVTVYIRPTEVFT